MHHLQFPLFTSKRDSLGHLPRLARGYLLSLFWHWHGILPTLGTQTLCIWVTCLMLSGHLETGSSFPIELPPLSN